MRTHNHTLKSGVSQTPEFEKKKLAGLVMWWTWSPMYSRAFFATLTPRNFASCYTPSGLLTEDKPRIRKDDAGVIWLGKKQESPTAVTESLSPD